MGSESDSEGQGIHSQSTHRARVVPSLATLKIQLSKTSDSCHQAALVSLQRVWSLQGVGVGYSYWQGFLS